MALHCTFMFYRFQLRQVLLAAGLLVLPPLDVTLISDSALDTFPLEPHFPEAPSSPDPQTESLGNVVPPGKRVPAGGCCRPPVEGWSTSPPGLSPQLCH